MRFGLITLITIGYHVSFLEAESDHWKGGTKEERTMQLLRNSASESGNLHKDFEAIFAHYEKRNNHKALRFTEASSSSSSSSRALSTDERYKCDEVIATIHPSNSSAIVDKFVELIPEFGLVMNLMFSNIIEYGVQVKTVCAACNTAVIGFDKPLQNPEFRRYCGSEAYGYDKIQSGLVMIPMVVDKSGDGSEGDLIPLKGTLPGFIHARSTKINRFDIPSQLYSSQFSIEVLVSFLATATRGAVSFAPDFMGFGYSESVKSYLIRDAYVTSTLPLWMKVSVDLSLETSSRSMLADAVAVEGYSEGGYAAVAIAEGLNKALDVDVIQVRSGAGAYDITRTLMSIIKRMGRGVIDDYWNIGCIIGASYSSTNTHVANYNSGQDLLNAKYMNASNPDLNVIYWLEDENASAGGINQKLKNLIDTQGIEDDELMSELWNPELIAFLEDAIQSNITEPCTPSYKGYEVGKHDKLCEAFAQNSLYEVLYNANYHIHICHSVDDELVTYDNVPDLSKNPEHLTLSIQSGNHLEAASSCFLGDFLFFTSSNFREYIPKPKHVDESDLPPRVESSGSRISLSFLITTVVFLLLT